MVTFFSSSHFSTFREYSLNHRTSSLATKWLRPNVSNTSAPARAGDSCREVFCCWTALPFCPRRTRLIRHASRCLGHAVKLLHASVTGVDIRLLLCGRPVTDRWLRTFSKSSLVGAFHEENNIEAEQSHSCTLLAITRCGKAKTIKKGSKSKRIAAV